MRKDLVKFRKVITGIACTPLILISSSLELAAKFLPNEEEKLIENQNFDPVQNNLLNLSDINRQGDLLIAENDEISKEESVLISEIIIEGWENHPEGRKLELAAYDSMNIKPGSIINNQILKKDLNSIIKF